MQNQQPDYDGDNLAEIWQSAQHRRTEDIYSWFSNFFERQRRIESSESRPRYPQRRAAAFVWKLLEATHAVSQTTNLGGS
jgi:hypothetical protein